MLFIALFFCCSSDGPSFDDERKALDAFHEFEKARAVGEWDSAEKALKSAINHLPESRNLQSWLVFLQYEKGDYDACVEMGRNRIIRYPGEGQLRYTLASCLARLNRYSEAASHLSILVQDGRFHPYEIGEDSNFSKMLGISEYEHLVKQPELNVGIVDSVKSVVVGQESSFRIQVRYRSTTQLELGAPVSSDFQITKISEMYSDLDDHMSMCQIDIHFRALRAGQYAVSGWSIADGVQTKELEAYSFEAISINEEHFDTPLLIEPLLPSAVLSLDTLPYVNLKQDNLYIVAAPPNALIKHSPAQMVELELWKDKTLQSKGRVIEKGIEKLRLSVVYGDTVILEGEY